MLTPLSFSLGPFNISFYGITLAVAILFFIIAARNEAEFYGEDKGLVEDLLLWIFVPSLIGARLYHVIHLWYFYRENLIRVFYVWEGGLAIFGALFGGVFGLYIASKRMKLAFKRWLDILAPALALGQAVGRWGNFFNREIYGVPTDLPWRLFIEEKFRPEEFMRFSYFHPLFLYESLLNFLNFVSLIFISRRFKDKLKSADLFLIYLLNYSLIRFFLEGLRFDNWQIFSIPTAQIISAILALLSVSSLLLKHLKG